MLIHRTTFLTKSKLLLLIFLLIAGLQVSAKNDSRFIKEKNGDFIVYKKGKITLSSIDTVKVFDGDTRTVQTRFDRHDPKPIAVNGKKILMPTDGNDQAVYSVALESTKQFNKYIVDGIQPLLEQLENGAYSFPIFNKVVDEQGNLTYFEINDTLLYIVKEQSLHDSYNPSGNRISTNLNEAINKKLYKLLQDPLQFKILELNGSATPYELFGSTIVVKDHKVISY
ncbi:MAG TPA: hypothetical protein VN721_14880 [Flavipsychrobacter sp.]|nr:hypothetical protein [Flavipsychrobacter sp.]